MEETAGAKGAEVVPPESRAGIAALAFVLLTLVALVGIPALVQWQVTGYREEIVASEPSRTYLTQLQLNLVRGLLVENQLLLEPADTLEEAVAAIRAREDSLFRALEPLAAQLGPEVTAAYRELRSEAERWHSRVGEALATAGRTDSRVGLIDDAADREAFSELMTTAAGLDQAILDITIEARNRISATEATGLRLVYLLGALALVAAVIVAVLWTRLRRAVAAAEAGRLEAERQREAAEARRQETEAALRAVARANEARARLLRGITHDVKNPLGAARGYAQLLAMGIKAPIHPEQAPLVQGVERSIDSALAIIDDLLDLARSESGGLSIRPMWTDLRHLVRLAVDDYRAAAEAAGLDIAADIPPHPIPVHTDPDRVRQVLGNLLSNAVKYTPPPGNILVRADPSPAGAPGPGSWACVSVSDSGPGIPEDKRDLVFGEFTRLEPTSGVKGHGLGLAIARRIAHLLGGELTLASDGGPGATFHLWLPCHDEPAPKEAPRRRREGSPQSA